MGLKFFLRSSREYQVERVRPQMKGYRVERASPNDSSACGR
jgi:hypothetical protein